jgi:SAM-dependent methyltransferase
MVSQAKANLTGRADIDLYMVVDAQFIPYPAGSFEAVIANHCLYHIPDRGKALSEIHRVLVPGGRLFATTIGQTHMAEIKGLVERFDPKAEHVFNSEEVSFTLENGAAQLRPWFQNLERRRYPDSLRVNRAEPLVDFVFSGIRFGMGEDRRSAFMVFVQDELERGGGELHIQKDSGLFIARGPKPRPAA